MNQSSREFLRDALVRSFDVPVLQRLEDHVVANAYNDSELLQLVNALGKAVALEQDVDVRAQMLYITNEAVARMNEGLSDVDTSSLESVLDAYNQEELIYVLSIFGLTHQKRLIETVSPFLKNKHKDVREEASMSLTELDPERFPRRGEKRGSD